MKAIEAETLLREFLTFLESKGMLTEKDPTVEPVAVPASVQPFTTVRQTIDVKTASELMGVSTGTIYTMVRLGEIPHVRVRGRVLFARDAIETWLRRGATAKQA